MPLLLSWRAGGWLRPTGPEANLDVVQYVPAVLDGELVPKGRHRGSREAVAEPIEELGVSVPGSEVNAEVGWPWLEGDSGGAITPTARPVAHGTAIDVDLPPMLD